MPRFSSTPFDMTAISVYAPTAQSEPNAKDAFYNEHQGLVNCVSRYDMLLIAVGWNARTGPANEYAHHDLGRFGLGERCENDILILCADLNRLIITNTRFQHPKRHLLTRYFNDG